MLSAHASEIATRRSASGNGSSDNSTSVNNTVHRDVDPDPNSQSDNNGNSESRRPAELAKSELEVVHVVTVIIRHEGQ